MASMRLGCNTVLFGRLALGDALQRVAWCGYAEVELAAIPGMAEHLTLDADPAEVRALAEGAGLRAVAIEAAMDLTNPANRERFRQVLEFGAALGVEVVNTGGGGASDNPESERAVHAALGELATYAASLGLALGLKAHVNQAVYDTASALRALDAVPPEGWGINYDASHLYRVGDDPADAARRLAPRLASVHIRDTLEPVIPIGPPHTQIPGRGSIDLEGVLAALGEAGYAGPLNLEVIGGAGLEEWQAVAVAAESRGYLRRLMDRAP